MRIFYLNPCAGLGGAETSLRELLASLRAAEPSWELHLVLGEDGPFSNVARNLGVQVTILPFPQRVARLGDSGGGLARTVWSLVKALPAAALYSRRLARWLSAQQPGLIHTNGFKMHLFGAWARPGQTVLVWHIHDYVSTRRFASRLLRMASKKCGAAIVNSKSVARDVEKTLPGLPVRPIYNCVDLERFSPLGPKADLDASAGLETAAPGTVRVGLVGTFARWKGHKVFLRALSLVSSAARPVRGYIIGGPIYRTEQSQWSLDELQAEARNLGVEVGFTGFLPDPADAMRSLDMLVHASTEPEPFGMVIIEGMACAKPVIASQAGGASELFTDGENALAHSPGDARALANQIERLAGDAELRARIGNAGRKTVEKTYHRKRLADEVVALYASVSPAGSLRPAAVAVQPPLGRAINQDSGPAQASPRELRAAKS